ncbi:cupin domain-containing protein [Streptosporangium soli]|nr:cupin domain-containing protein [Streptosporangium sp. KLBMP 9127]
MHSAQRIMFATAAVVGLGLMPETADATRAAGLTGKILSHTTSGGKDYILREITVEPGGTTGWHYHDGKLYTWVKRGALTHTAADCTTTETYRAGNMFAEASGADNVHLGRNLGRGPLVLEVLYVNPPNSPLVQDAANPGCSFQ